MNSNDVRRALVPLAHMANRAGRLLPARETVEITVDRDDVAALLTAREVLETMLLLTNQERPSR